MRQRGEGTQAEKVEDPALIPAGREISKGQWGRKGGAKHEVSGCGGGVGVGRGKASTLG